MRVWFHSPLEPVEHEAGWVPELFWTLCGIQCRLSYNPGRSPAAVWTGDCGDKSFPLLCNTSHMRFPFRVKMQQVLHANVTFIRFYEMGFKEKISSNILLIKDEALSADKLGRSVSETTGREISIIRVMGESIQKYTGQILCMSLIFCNIHILDKYCFEYL
jgi:hypothetical protein